MRREIDVERLAAEVELLREALRRAHARLSEQDARIDGLEKRLEPAVEAYERVLCDLRSLRENVAGLAEP